MASCHALSPLSDGDKCICRVRLSQKEGRTVGKTPRDLTCDSCVVVLTRLWWSLGQDIEALGEKFATTWPWDDPRWEERHGAKR